MLFVKRPLEGLGKICDTEFRHYYKVLEGNTSLWSLGCHVTKGGPFATGYVSTKNNPRKILIQ